MYTLCGKYQQCIRLAVSDSPPLSWQHGRCGHVSGRDRPEARWPPLSGPPHGHRLGDASASAQSAAKKKDKHV